MSEYTPTIVQGERAYIDGLAGTSRTREESAAEYRRMIAGIERAAAVRALELAANEIVVSAGFEHSYDGEHGFNDGADSVCQALRARAAEIREGEELNWHYQVTKELVNGEVEYAIREVYEYEDGKKGWTARPIPPSGESKQDVIIELNRMAEDAWKYPVLDIGEVVE